MIAWLTTSGDGWAVAPIWIAAGALLAVVAVLIGLRAERARQDREAHEASLQLSAAMRERDADLVVERYLATGMTPDAVRRAAHGGPLWCAAVDRALERRGPTGTARSAPGRAS